MPFSSLSFRSGVAKLQAKTKELKDKIRANKASTSSTNPASATIPSLGPPITLPLTAQDNAIFALTLTTPSAAVINPDARAVAIWAGAFGQTDQSARENIMAIAMLDRVFSYLRFNHLAVLNVFAPIRRNAEHLEIKIDHPSLAQRVDVLLQLQNPIPDAATIRNVLQLEREPETIEMSRAGATTRWCRVSHAIRDRLLDHFATMQLDRSRLNFAEVRRARKQLSPISSFPSIGRPSRFHDPFASRPFNNEYPVWYFVYGPHAETELLRFVLGGEDFGIRTGFVEGGTLRRWRNYEVLVVGTPDPTPVQGWAFVVRTESEERSLLTACWYPTHAFDVVRCTIQFHNGAFEVPGVTFRLAPTVPYN